MLGRLREALSARLSALPRYERWLLAGAMGAAFVAVVAYVLASRPHALAGDEPEYHLQGLFFTEGKLWWSTTPFGEAHASAWKAPGYPAWVGLWYSLLGAVPIRVELVQALLAPVTVLLTWVLARRFFGPPAAVLAAWLVALFPLAFEYYGLLYPEAIAVPLTLAALAVVLGREPSRGRVIAAGLLLGVNLLVRPTSFFLVAAFAAAWIVAAGWRRGFAASAATVAIAALVVVPWTVRNAVVNDGGLIPISVQDAAAFGTFNELSANDPDYPYAWRINQEALEGIVDLRRPISDAEFRSRVQDAALDYIAEHPLSVPQAFFWNGIVRFWDLRPPSQSLQEARTEGRSTKFRAVGLGIYYVLLPLALVGLWRARRRLEVVAPALALAAVASLAFTVVATTRYRAPLEPLVAIMAAYALVGAAVPATRLARAGPGVAAAPRPAMPAITPGRLLAGSIALLVAGACVLYGGALFGGKVLAGSDALLFSPPFESQKPPELTRPANPNTFDANYGFHPHQEEAREAIRDGRLPSWNPHQAGGRPLGANTGGPFYPLHWLSYLLPFWESLGLIAALQVLIAALGTLCFCRRIGLAVVPALLAAVAFSFGTYFMVAIDHPQADAYSLLPWALLLVERLANWPRWMDALGLGLLFGCALVIGHPETSVAFGIGVLAFAAFRFRQAVSGVGEERERARRAAGLFASATGIGFAAGAIAVLPTVELLPESFRTERGKPGLPLSTIAAAVFPEMWGRPDKVTFPAPGNTIFADRAIYLGAIPLLFAIGGLVARRTPLIRFLAVASLVGLVLFFDLPGVRSFGELPLISTVSLRQFVWLGLFSGSVLAGWGLHLAISGSTVERRRVVVASCVAALVPLVWIAFHAGVLSELPEAVRDLPNLGAGVTDPDRAALTSVLRWGLFAGAGVVLAWLAFSRPRWALTVAVVAVALTLVDLVSLGRGYQPELEESLVESPTPASIRFLSSPAQQGRVAGASDALLPNLAERYELEDMRGHDLPELERYSRLYEGYGGEIRPAFGLSLFDPGSPRANALADLFAVEHVIDGGESPAPDWLRPTAVDLPGDRLLANPGALPRAFVAYQWRPASGLEEAVRLTVASPTRSLLRAPVIEGLDAAPETGPAPTPATIVDEGHDELRVRVETQRPGLLVVLDAYYPGWKAEVDGEPARILAANGAFRAVALPAGADEVTFEYEPTSLKAGALLSGATVVGCLMLLVVGAFRRARRSALGEMEP
jgi:4-amino-4-deoxy-L-arabinose transferase-like glycosyltransferase